MERNFLHDPGSTLEDASHVRSLPMSEHCLSPCKITLSMSTPTFQPRRIVNIVNFIRYDDHRYPQRDLLEPVIRQMELLKKASLPCTWLLQFDALIAGPYVDFLKANLPPTHEVGLWFEINRMHCDAAAVPFHGQPGINWDHHVQAAFSIGYTPPERDRLTDVAVDRFQEIFGRPPRSVAAWYIDAHVMARLADKHHVEAFAICRDQYGTDGYTFWGGPFSGGYYPSRNNAFCPAQTSDVQINTPVFRLLGSDPIHQYDLNLGQTKQDVLTLEVIYEKAGKNRQWVQNFLDILTSTPTLSFSYAQAGQENSFGWERMREGYQLQVSLFEQLCRQERLEFETLGDTGRWFRKTYSSTPPQSVAALSDTLGGERRSIWYHSRHYRANLLLEHDRIYMRDMHLFDQSYTESYLSDTCQTQCARFDALPILDGFGWSRSMAERAAGEWSAFVSDHSYSTLKLAGNPLLRELDNRKTLALEFPIDNQDTLHIVFAETGCTFSLASAKAIRFSVRWAPHAIVDPPTLTIAAKSLAYTHNGFAYTVRLNAGQAIPAENGFDVYSDSRGLINLRFIDSP